MKDPEIEDLLRKYRPVGPPPECATGSSRRLVCSASGHGPVPRPRSWYWGLPSQVAVRKEVAGADLNFGPSAVTRVTEDLTNMLGGDLRARELAEFIVVEQQVHSETTTAAVEPVNGAGGVQR